MRQWIDLVENKNRSRKTLVAMAQPYYDKILKGNRSRREPMMFRNIEDFIRTLTSIDPTCSWSKGEAKYFGWLLRMFAKEPWMTLQAGWKGKRVWGSDWRKDGAISDALKALETGKVQPRDINAYKSIDELIAATKDLPKGKAEPFRMKLQWSEDGRGCNANVYIDGESAGNFVIDFTHKDDKKVSIHSFLRKEYEGKGIGHRVYGWIAQKLRDKGYTLIPSDRLTDRAYNLWKKRDPNAIEGYTRHESRESPNGFLWLSPYWKETVIPKQEAAQAERDRKRAEWEADQAERRQARQETRYTLDQLIRGDDQKGLPPAPEQPWDTPKRRAMLARRGKPKAA